MIKKQINIPPKILEIIGELYLNNKLLNDEVEIVKKELEKIEESIKKQDKK